MSVSAPRFVTSKEAQVEYAPWGKHWWMSRPGFTDSTQLMFVRVTMPPGAGHQFHYHPAREEILYVLDGVGEQWVETRKKHLKAGESAFIPKRTVHAIYNASKKPMTFLAILSPAAAKGPFLVDCYQDAPWCGLRKPFAYRDVDPKTGQTTKAAPELLSCARMARLGRVRS